MRHRGTIGGSTGNADPAVDYPGGIMGLGAHASAEYRAHMAAVIAKRAVAAAY